PAGHRGTAASAFDSGGSLGTFEHVNIGAILIIVIAASGVLMMRFRKRCLAKINIAFTNRITSLFAGWLPGFGILTHMGRKSGKVYRTPVNVFRASNGFIIALTYSGTCPVHPRGHASSGCAPTSH